MIFVTLGSQKYQFNRLLQAVDGQIEQGRIQEPVFAQTGYSDYQPRNFEGKQFLNADEFGQYLDRAEVIVTHSGTGTIVKALKKGKKVVVCPRLPQYKEHEDDHQRQIAKTFEDMGMVASCEDLSDLPEAIEKARKLSYAPYVSNTARIMDSIERFILSDGKRKGRNK